jgi:hypothetical protein
MVAADVAAANHRSLGSPRDDGPTETIPRELLESMLIDTPMDDVPDD